MCKEDFERRIREWIDCCDHHAIFSHGACYHFALKLNSIRDLKLACFRSADGGVGHCWARRDDGMAIDVNGVLPEACIIRINSGKAEQPEEISKEDLERELKSRSISDDLNNKLFKLAEMIIWKHVRFSNAKKISTTCAEIYS